MKAKTAKKPKQSGRALPSKKKRRARRTEPDLRAAVLNSARHLFSRHGYAETSIRDIANDAGLAVGGVFRPFPRGKYEIFLQVYDEAWQEINETLERRIPTDVLEPDDRLCQMVSGIWELYGRQPTLVRLATINSGNSSIFLATEDEPPLYTEQNKLFVRSVDSLCLECQSLGKIPRSVSPAALREMILGVLEGVVLGWYLADRKDSEYPERVTLDEASQMLHSIFAGLQLQRSAEGRRF